MGFAFLASVIGLNVSGLNTAATLLACVFGAITDAMAADDKVTLLGFGTFSVSERAAREGRNPQTGETMSIPAKKVVKFKDGTKLVETECSNKSHYHQMTA